MDHDLIVFPNVVFGKDLQGRGTKTSGVCTNFDNSNSPVHEHTALWTTFLQEAQSSGN